MSHYTPLEALRLCVEALRLTDFSECKDEAVWHAVNAAQQVAEEVLCEDKQSEIWIVQKLRDAAADPMWYEHSEVSKSLLIGAANIIEAASARVAKLKSASQEPYAYAYECVQPGTDGKGWAQFINRKPVSPQDGVRNIIPLYAAPVAAQQAVAPQPAAAPSGDVASLPEKMSAEMREAMWEAITRHGAANLEYWIEDLYNDIRAAALKE